MSPVGITRISSVLDSTRKVIWVSLILRGLHFSDTKAAHRFYRIENQRIKRFVASLLLLAETSMSFAKAQGGELAFAAHFSAVGFRGAMNTPVPQNLTALAYRGRYGGT
jgi:hypothetical protein